MKSVAPLKTSWTWAEWQQSRALRKTISDQVSPTESRRSKSSADRRLKAAFSGRRAP
jgi:hypothetical protein